MIHTCALKAMTARKHMERSPSKLSCLSWIRSFRQYHWYMDTLMFSRFIIVFLHGVWFPQDILSHFFGRFSVYPLRARPERSAEPQARVDGVQLWNVLWMGILLSGLDEMRWKKMKMPRLKSCFISPLWNSSVLEMSFSGILLQLSSTLMSIFWQTNVQCQMVCIFTWGFVFSFFW